MNTLNLALVGCGNMSGDHARNFLKLPEAKIVALCDTVPAQTQSFRKQFFPDAAEFTSYDALLDMAKKIPGKDGASVQLDGVVLVTPHTLHHAQCKAALARGLHVLCEKPMVTSSPDAYDLWKAVKKSGKIFAIAYQSPYSREFGYLAAERDAGHLGKIQLISAYLSQGWLQATANTWRQNPALSGGGQMYDSGAHLLNAFMWLINDPVVEVACFYDTCGSPVDINGVAAVKFANGVMGSICIGGNCPNFRTEIEIQTDKMLIVTNQYGSKLEMTGRGNVPIYPHIAPDDRPAAGTPQANFVNAILRGEPLRAPVRYGVLLSALMDAMYQSAREQKPVRVQPVPADI